MDPSYPSASKMTRRRLLNGAARLAAAAAASTLMPPNVRGCWRRRLQKGGSLRDIKHVVLLMQENRSFDHYFGTLAGVRGFGDPIRSELPNGQIGLPSAGCGEPQRLPAAVPSGHAQDQRAEDSLHQPRLGGAARGLERRQDGQWLPAHRKADGANGPYCMGYYTRAIFPFSSRWRRRSRSATPIIARSWGRPGRTACIG